MQPDPAADDDRDCIIDAAYSCLSEPHGRPVPVATVLARAGVSTRAFYRHFESKDELFLAMMRRDVGLLTSRLDLIAADSGRAPIEQLRAWITHMFDLVHDPRLRMQAQVLDSIEVRSAKGYRAARHQWHVDRERSLVQILRRGRDDGSFPLATPDSDAVAIGAVVTHEMTRPHSGDPRDWDRTLQRIVDFAMRAIGAQPAR